VPLLDDPTGVRTTRLEPAATPEQARRPAPNSANACAHRDNYFGEIEMAAADLLTATGYEDGLITRHVVKRLGGAAGFSAAVHGGPAGIPRMVTDLAHRMIYLPQPEAGQHDSRALALQALGHVVLDHQVPRDCAAFLEQRVEINYFAAALLIPERGALTLLRKAKAAKDIAI
jgi:XRE family transcriptional regulator, fatty acid utilization regulator